MKIRKDIKANYKAVFFNYKTVRMRIDQSKSITAPKYPEIEDVAINLCAGRGQFTIRMLRKFSLDNSNFDIKYYLSNWHWFNEINEQSCKELLKIFGHNINLAIGPAQELKNYPEDEFGIWLRGIFKYGFG